MTRTNYFLFTIFLVLSVFILRAQENVEIWQMPIAKLSEINNIDSDTLGNTYYTAMFAGEMTLAGNKIKANPSAYVIFAKNSNEEIIWTKLLPFNVKDIAATENGVWVLGQSLKAFSFPEKSLQEYTNPIILLLLSNEGNIEYIAEGGSNDSPAYASAIKYSNGKLSFMVGFEEKFDFDGNSYTTDMEKNQLIVNLNEEKHVEWTHLLTGGDSYITGIWASDFTHDLEGNTWVVGEMSGTVKSGDISYTTHKTIYGPGESLYDSESFLIKINVDGKSESLNKIITEADCEDIICMKDSTLLISGYFKGDIQGDKKAISCFGDKEITGTLNKYGDATEDSFVAKFDKNLNCIWVARGKGGSANRITSSCEDNIGNIFISGFAMYEFGFEGSSGACPVEAVMGSEQDRYSFSDAFIIKLSPEGNFEYIKRGGGSESDDLKCIHISNGKLRAGGSFNGTIVFDGNPINMQSKYYSGVEIIITL